MLLSVQEVASSFGRISVHCSRTEAAGNFGHERDEQR